MSVITSLLLQEGYPQYSREFGKPLRKVYKYEIDYDLVVSNIPADYAQDPQGETGYFFQNCQVSGGSSPLTRFLTISYGAIDSGSMTSSARQIGSVIYSSTTMSTERPIEEHPSYSDPTFADKVAAAGIKTYLVMSPQFVRSEIVNGNYVNISESLITAGMQVQGAPQGLNGANSARWVKTGREINSDGNRMEIRDIYSYDARGWLTADFGLNNLS